MLGGSATLIATLLAIVDDLVPGRFPRGLCRDWHDENLHAGLVHPTYRCGWDAGGSTRYEQRQARPHHAACSGRWRPVRAPAGGLGINDSTNTTTAAIRLFHTVALDA